MKQENKQKINNAINYWALLFVFCLPLSRAGIVLTSSVLFLLWIAEGGFKEKITLLRTTPFVVSALILTSYMLVTLLWSESISEGLMHFKRLWYYFVLFVFITSLRSDFIPYMVATFLSAMFISEVLSYGIFFELWTMNHGSPLDPTPFMNHLEYSFFLCATSTLLLLKFILEKRWNWAKVSYGLFFLSATTNLFITGGRSGQIAFILIVMTLIIVNIENKIRSVSISTFLLASILSTAYTFSPIFHDRILEGFSELSTFVEEGSYHGSWGARLEFWDVGLSAAKKEPILGIGIGDITEHLRNSKKSSSVIKHVPSGGYHSDLLVTMVAGGLIGTIFFVSIFVLLWKAKVKDPLVNNMRIIVTVLFVFGWGIDNFLRAQFTIVLFIFFVGILLAQQRHEKTETLKS